MGSSAAPRITVSDHELDLFSRLVAGQQPGADDSQALENLLSLGLVREDLPEGFVPVDPASVEARAAADLYREASRALADVAAVADAFRAPRQAYESRPRAEGCAIESLRGSAIINARLGPILAGVKSEILSCQPGRRRNREVRQVAESRDSEALRRGVVMRTLYHESVRGGEGMDRWVADMTALGAQIRTLDEPFSRMIIIDRQVAVIPADTIIETSNEAIAHIIHDTDIADFLARAVFDANWERAEPWGRERDISDRGQLILAALARGEAVETIGRRLGLGKTMMAQEIRQLKETYGAKTLPQLMWKHAMARKPGSRARVSSSARHGVRP